MVVLHLSTRRYNGRQTVITMCEGVASLRKRLPAARYFCGYVEPLDQLARAQVVIPVNNLEGKGFSGAAVRDGINLNGSCNRDPYRAPRQQRHHERHDAAALQPAMTGAR
jgi:hypothetical protein